MSPIEKVIQVSGGQSALARKLGVAPQSVQRWVAKKQVPVKRVVQIEAAVDGLITRYELRPDIFSAPSCV